MFDEQGTNYEEWLRQVPEVLSQDPLWDLETYRKVLFFSDLAWHDCEKYDQKHKLQIH